MYTLRILSEGYQVKSLVHNMRITSYLYKAGYTDDIQS